MKRFTKFALALMLSIGFLVVHNNQAKAADGGWYKVTGAGDDCKVRVITDRTDYPSSIRTVNAQLESSGSCGTIYYQMSLSLGIYASEQDDATSGYFSSITPVKPLKISPYGHTKTQTFYVTALLFKNSNYTYSLGNIPGAALTIHPN
ncbi:hypothetical protein [Lysinibacillus sp. NPDC059133]|uniref:hypothetical protein n=1 Tax=Lysinibacillus sp. NPDC059133 TaxID=3346737 RepID=UPI00368D96CD